MIKVERYLFMREKPLIIKNAKTGKVKATVTKDMRWAFINPKDKVKGRILFSCVAGAFRVGPETAENLRKNSVKVKPSTGVQPPYLNKLSFDLLIKGKSKLIAVELQEKLKKALGPRKDKSLEKVQATLTKTSLKASTTVALGRTEKDQIEIVYGLNFPLAETAGNLMLYFIIPLVNEKPKLVTNSSLAKDCIKSLEEIKKSLSKKLSITFDKQALASWAKISTASISGNVYMVTYKIRDPIYG